LSRLLTTPLLAAVPPCRLTDSAIAENLIAALFAGHDTTSTALADLVVALQDNPHVMAKLRQEQQELQAQHGDTITACVLKNMTYADAVIRESLRVKPVVADTNRVAARDIELGGCLIKKDTMLLVPQLYLAANVSCDARSLCVFTC
jgi:cytochrome P450